MSTNPLAKSKLSRIDQFLEIAGWGTIILIWGNTLFHYSHLPDKIPTHFNFAGDADSFGHKGMILLLPLIATLLFIKLNAVTKSPQKFNYPIPITENNAEKVYLYSSRMMRYLKFILVVIFNIIVFKTIEQAQGHSQGLGTWFLPLVLVLVLLPLLYFLVKIVSASNKSD
ncbi:DUF1648 domain-containing protein [Arcicella rigui]|uniref:DUF1648 domain-containing protein n=1 Tax=Arcicella rigui TaxID=797020 RepID=A0ABU5Q997_9BACT|nr:DUF1648 domain-containing protein [Arcicella rigui]MEA5139426.1 DUF1648 domain-containing protein [Arcicella rigui]